MTGAQHRTLPIGSRIFATSPEREALAQTIPQTPTDPL